MIKRHRVYTLLLIFGFVAIALAGFMLTQSIWMMGKTASPSLNKSAVGPDTPFVVLGMGCFWGAEKRMAELNGVLDVEAGYAGGDIANPTYQTLHETESAIESGKAIKNHAEVVKVFYDPKQTTLEQVLIQFWENHNPTQGNRQGNDIGSNYRSAVFYRNDNERQSAEKTRDIYQANLRQAGINDAITTEITPLINYMTAEDYHQDYLDKNPLGYCGRGGTGVAYADPDQSLPPQKAKSAKPVATENWTTVQLNEKEQLVAFETPDCGYCRKFDHEVLTSWHDPIPIHATNLATPPPGWKLNQALFATPTIVFFKNKQEISRYTGYQTAQKFWDWLATVKIGIELH